MPEPKISRRCPTCKASIRDHAFFCPQCGGKLDPPKSQKKEFPAIHDTVEEVVDPDQTITESDFRARIRPPKTETPPLVEVFVDPNQTITESDFRAGITAHKGETTPPVEEFVDPNQTITESDFRARTKAQKSERTPPAEVSKKAARQRAPGEGTKIQRVTDKARDVEDDVKQRVQKFREISNVVIDEASYDPSLRFVLVAAVLFVLFVVIALLNKFIG